MICVIYILCSDLVDEGFIRILMKHLYSEDWKIRKLCINGLRHLLKKGVGDHGVEGFNCHEEIAREEGLFNVLKSIQGPPEVRTFAHWVLTKFGRPEEQLK